MVESTSFFQEEFDRGVLITFVVIHFIILLTSLIGSTALCLIVVTSKDLRTPLDIYLANLCIVFVALSLLGAFLLDNVLMDWSNGNTLCQTVHYGIQTCFLTVNLILTSVTLERYFCVCKPSCKYGKILKRPHLVCLLCWILAGIFSVPVLFLVQVQSQNHYSWRHERVCVIIWPPVETWQVYFCLLACAFYVVPFMAMFCLQGFTLRKLQEPQSTRSGGNRILNQSRRQILCILMAVSGSHFILLFPYEILSMLYYFDVKISYLHIAWCIAVILKFTPAAVTSFVFLLKHEPLKRSFKELINGFCNRKETVDNNQI